jgi:hypothetical protein
LSKEEREDILKSAGLPIGIPPDHALAMKADLAIPWATMREISRYIKSHIQNTHGYCITYTDG